jgi:hypothetical protein
MTRIIAFAGPCLPREPDAAWRRALDGVELWPPARRGDVLLALGHDPDLLLLLDGYYFTVPAVTHKELLYALESGVPVLGAASMGALRAAEMAAFGMEGMGWVFERFHGGDLEGDDEVAVVHGPPERGYEAVTTALVDVRFALEELVERGGVPERGARELVERLIALPFTERFPETVSALARETLGNGVDALEAHLAGERIKQRDAYRALQRAAELAGDGTRRRSRKRPTEVSTFLSFFREWSLRTEHHGPTYRRAWGAAQLLHPGAPAFVDALRRRFLLLSAAREQGLEPEPTALADRRSALAETLNPSGLRLPPAEIEAEAADQVLAEAARQQSPTFDEAVQPAARLFGWQGEPRAVDRMLELLDLQEGLLPQWHLVRAFLFTPAAPAALTLAASTDEVERAFRKWSEGADVSRDDLRRLAADLWGLEHASSENVAAAARHRALHLSHGFADGFYEIAAWLAPSERLPRPINEYPEHRRSLLHHPLTLPHPFAAGARR